MMIGLVDTTISSAIEKRECKHNRKAGVQAQSKSLCANAKRDRKAGVQAQSKSGSEKKG